VAPSFQLRALHKVLKSLNHIVCSFISSEKNGNFSRDQTQSDFLSFVAPFFQIVDNLRDECLEHQVRAVPTNIRKILASCELEPHAKFIDSSLPQQLYSPPYSQSPFGANPVK
jgi:hypothetical protein